MLPILDKNIEILSRVTEKLYTLLDTEEQVIDELEMLQEEFKILTNEVSKETHRLSYYLVQPSDL